MNECKWLWGGKRVEYTAKIVFFSSFQRRGSDVSNWVIQEIKLQLCHLGCVKPGLVVFPAIFLAYALLCMYLYWICSLMPLVPFLRFVNGSVKDNHWLHSMSCAEWLCPLFLVPSSFNLVEDIPAVILVLHNVQRKGKGKKYDAKYPALLTKGVFLFDRVHWHQALYFSHATIDLVKWLYMAYIKYYTQLLFVL